MDTWNGKVTVDSKEYKIEWVHDRMDLEFTLGDMRFKSCTYCNVALNEFLAGSSGKGEARCSWSDNFSRKVGRKLSLQRALLNSPFNAGQRRQVWDQVLAIKGLVK